MAGTGYANRLRPKADFGGSRGFAGQASQAVTVERARRRDHEDMKCRPDGRINFDSDRHRARRSLSTHEKSHARKN
jgi:hypothetical protein